MKVIFVDESKIVLNTLRTLVSELIDSHMIECEFYSDSSHVKQMLESGSLEYSLMFTDINMSEVSGYDLARTAKSIQRYKDKPIIAITTEYTQEAKKAAKAAGIEDWFVKSITQDSLQPSIINAIRQLDEEEEDVRYKKA